MDRKLLKLTLSSGSSKVFNCLERTREISVCTDGDKPPAHLFSNRAINYGIFYKEPTDKALIGTGSIPVDTLLYFPYDREKISDGGVSVSLNDPRFEAVLKEFTETFGTSAHKNPANDRAIFDILRGTPSLDPYLLKAAFQRAGIEVHDDYLQISEEEWLAIRDFVRKKLYPMITFGLTGSSVSAARIDEFIERIWAGTDVTSIYPLFNALQIPTQEADATIFAWKGLTFFEFIYERKTPAIRDRVGWLRTAKPADIVRSETKKRLEVRRVEIRNKLRSALQLVVGILDSYNAAYERLFVQQAGALEFKTVMLNCPSSYLSLGAALNKIDHTCEIIDRATKGDPTRVLVYDDLEELFQCLFNVLK